MSPYSAQSSLQCTQSVPSLDCHQKEEDVNIPVISEAETVHGKQEDAVVKAAEELQRSKGNLSELGMVRT